MRRDHMLPSPARRLGEGANATASPHGAMAGSRTIEASELKTRRFRLMDEVAETGEEIVITRHGRPVSRLVPRRAPPQVIFGADRDIIRIHGDIGEPPDVEWEAGVDPGRVLDPRSCSTRMSCRGCGSVTSVRAPRLAASSNARGVRGKRLGTEHAPSP